MTIHREGRSDYEKNHRKQSNANSRHHYDKPLTNAIKKSKKKQIVTLNGLRNVPKKWRRKNGERDQRGGVNIFIRFMNIYNLLAMSLILMLIITTSSWLTLMSSAQLSGNSQQQDFLIDPSIGQQSTVAQSGIASAGAASAQPSAIPPIELRPRVNINLHDWANRLSDDIRAVGNRTNCVYSIKDFYETKGKPQLLDPVKLRDNVLAQIDKLLSQHKAAVSAIVNEAEQLAAKHIFIKNLTVNYTDVHRIRNELDPLNITFLNQQQQQQLDPLLAINNQQQAGTLVQDSYGNSGVASGNLGSSGSSGIQVPQFTSINGGTPVPGPPEWQTPFKSIVMRVNKNFGDIPVNTSMSAIHLPLPIYPGLPEIMNGIAWTERLDNVFKRNLQQYAHVHHQYYGDRLGLLRTFPAHKWRIPRTDPDLFDARTRPWYVAGASSPKNVVILIDSSGSMTGLRREIAKGVVFEILDTLTSSDYFSVMRFSESVTPIGLPKCQNLKQPKFSLQMREQCAALMNMNMNMNTINQNGINTKPMDSLSPASLRDQRLECTAFERQLERSQQYPRDHPDLIQGKNGSYLSDDAYSKSIRNVTNEIRDAYMLPATSRNIRYLKSNFSMPTAGIANFTNALMAAFELLQAYERTNDLGSQCNQAIMLITDGAMKSHEEIFHRYNYPNSPVRVFTYMIGREVGDITHTKAMACNNRGYYTHVINLSEVREQVLKYLAVMARPLVLVHHHPISWTPAYGDETYQVLTDWVLEIKRRERARIMLNEERERLNEANSSDVIAIELTNIQEYDELTLVDEELKNRIICEDNTDDSGAMEQSLHDELDPLGYNDLGCHWTSRRADLLTSVVKPVFDNRNTTLVFQRVLHKNIWTEQETHVRNAQLLGIAAVDLRIADILKSIPSHLLGPNGYAILLGQNGFIMHHPDLRALLEDPFDKQSKILKPYFNSVDLTHIEQVYIKNETIELASNIRRILTAPKGDDIKLLKLREAAIRGQSGMDSFHVKRAVDCRRRPHIRQQTFYYGPIKDTPFSLLIAFPTSYGLNRITAKLDLNQQQTEHFKPSEYDLWTVHPNYKYCEGNGLINKNNDSVYKLLEIMKMVDSNQLTRIDYEDLNAISTPSSSSIGASHGNVNNQNNKRIVCDQELFPSLLFDAAATFEQPDSFCKTKLNNYNDNCDNRQSSYSFFGSSSPSNDNDDLCNTKYPDIMRSKLANIYGLEMSFVATRSGLTRVRVYDLSARIKKLADLFIQRHNKAVDESWYSRTVDWNMRFNEDATIVTVPYNAYIRLVAKLRQRITQRHPAVNDTRANCDPQLMGADESAPAQQESSVAAAGAASSPATATEADGQEANNNQDIIITSSTSAALTEAAQSGSSSDLSEMEASMTTISSMMVGTKTNVVARRQAPTNSQNESPIQYQNDETSSPTTLDGQQQQQEGSLAVATSGETSGQMNSQGQQNRIDYNTYSTYDFLDLLTNSSVHVSATQSVISNSGSKHRSPVAVTGLLYDYATFARRFLNTTSLIIKNYDQTNGKNNNDNNNNDNNQPDQQQQQQPTKIDICPNGDCPTKCGFRNDTIDCLLIDNNGFIIVGEELPYIGRSLSVYDEKLMLSLISKHVFHQITIIDYQAICTRSAEQVAADQKAAAASNSPAQLSQISSSAVKSILPSSINQADLLTKKVQIFSTLLANAASSLMYTAAAFYSLLFYKSTIEDIQTSWTGEPTNLNWFTSLAGAQSATANQSLLAMLPNKTYLRPCEKTITLYETRPPSEKFSSSAASDSSSSSSPSASSSSSSSQTGRLAGKDRLKLSIQAPEYYETKCNCSGWYVYQQIPKTNLIMLIVNTTSACRRCDQQQQGSLPATIIDPQLVGTAANYIPVVPPPVDLNGAPIVGIIPTSNNSIVSSLFGGGNKTAEDQVCSMLERDSQLYVMRTPQEACYAYNPDEFQIPLCGGAQSLLLASNSLLLLSLALLSIFTILIANNNNSIH